MISFSWGGDFRYFYSENILDFINFPFAWDSSLNTGIGQSQIGSLWIISYFNFTLLFNKLGLSWNLISLIFWILPAVLLSFFSSFSLFNYLFSRETGSRFAEKDKVKYSLLAGIIYILNTYFLMILTGGQLGVCLAYSLVPLVFLRFIKIIERPSLTNAIVAGLVLGLQLIFDPRIVYVTLSAVFLYMLFSSRGGSAFGGNFFLLKTIKCVVYLIGPFFISILLNIFWILPLILTKSSPIPEGFNSVKGFEFFSFSDFSHSLSLLHPNWPENIFGKVYFMKSEFILIPILAFSSLLFLINSTIKQFNPAKIASQFNGAGNRTILFFAILGLLGGFLAKGANPPFGEVNIWLFQYFPGMSIFRDPTKFYVLIALSYSVLISFSIYSLTNWIISNFKFQISNTHFKFKTYNVFLLFTILYLLFLIRPLWLGDLINKFKPREVPKEYVELKDFLYKQPEFFRTLWIPQWQRFGYFSNNHPAIGRYEILKSASASGQIKELANDDAKTLLKNLGVKYIIVPYDSEGEIFLIDRKYNEKERIEVEKTLDQIPWLVKVRLNDLNHLSKIAVYEIKGNKGHFWSPTTSLGINYNFLSPTKYEVEVKNVQKGDRLIFSEGFSKYWILRDKNSGFEVGSKEYMGILNSFIFPKSGAHTLRLYYEPQSLVNLGLVISIGGFIAAITALVSLKLKKW